MQEFVPLKKPINKAEIEAYLKQIGFTKAVFHNVSNEKVYKGLSDGRSAEKDTICFIDKEPSEAKTAKLEGTLVITTTTLFQSFPKVEAICTEDPRELFIKLIDFFDKHLLCEPFTSRIVVHPPLIHKEAIIHEDAIIEEGVSIGKESIISAGSVLKKGTVIGEHCIVRENCTIGCSGIALYKTYQGETLRFPHLAGVHIGNNVEIGAGTVIVRGTLLNTAISNDCVIGNQCNIGHGVKIGKKVWMSVGSLIGGNCNIGDNTTIGLGVRVRDNLKIGKGVSIGMGSVVTKNLPSGISVFGNPAKELRNLTTGPNR